MGAERLEEAASCRAQQQRLANDFLPAHFLLGHLAVGFQDDQDFIIRELRELREGRALFL
jgi:hypothetical protein